MPDTIYRITTSRAAFRCVAVWMPETAQAIFTQHHPSVETGEYLSNAAIASLLLASNLKGRGAVSIRFETNGIIGLMNADGTPDGLVRAMVARANIQDEPVSKKLKLPIIGPGTISVTKTYNDARKPYTGVSEIKSPYIGPIVADYLLSSEQIRSSVSTATLFNEGKITLSCGFLVEAFPEIQEKDLARMENNIKSMGNFREFVHNVKRAEELIEELLGGFEYQVIKEIPVQFYCPCSPERIIKSILGSGKKETDDIIKENKDLEVFCDYCRKRYIIQPSQIEEAIGKK